MCLALLLRYAVERFGTRFLCFWVDVDDFIADACDDVVIAVMLRAGHTVVIGPRFVIQRAADVRRWAARHSDGEVTVGLERNGVLDSRRAELPAVAALQRHRHRRVHEPHLLAVFSVYDTEQGQAWRQRQLR